MATIDRHEAIYDVSQAVIAARQLTDVFREQAIAIRGVNTAVITFNNNFRTLLNSQGQLSSAMQKQNAAVKQSTNSLKTSSQATNQLITYQNNLINANKNVASSFNQLAASGKKAGSDTLISWQSVARIFAARAFLTSISNIQNAISEGQRKAAEFSIRIAEIQTISQRFNLPTKQTEEWAAGLIKVSREFNIPVLEAAEAQYEAISNQVKGAADSFDFLETAAKFSKVSVSTLAESVNLLSSVLNSYQIDASRTDEVSAKLFKTIELGRVRASEMQDQFGRVAVVANQTGTSLDELTAAIATLTVQGVKYQASQTLIQNVLLKLVNPSEEMKKLFSSWGVASGDAAIKTFGLAGVLEKLNEETLKGNSALGELVEQFTNIRSVTGAAILGQNAELFKTNLGKIQTAQGEFNNAFAISMKSSGQIVTGELNDIKTSFVNFGGTINDALAGVDQNFIDLSDAFNLVIKFIPGLVGAFALYRKGVIDTTAATVSNIASVNSKINANTLLVTSTGKVILVTKQEALALEANTLAMKQNAVQAAVMASNNKQVFNAKATSGYFTQMAGNLNTVTVAASAASKGFSKLLGIFGAIGLAWTAVDLLAEAAKNLNIIKDTSEEGLQKIQDKYEEANKNISEINRNSLISTINDLQTITDAGFKELGIALANHISSVNAIAESDSVALDILSDSFNRTIKEGESSFKKQLRVLKDFKTDLEGITLTLDQVTKQYDKFADDAKSDFNKAFNAYQSFLISASNFLQDKISESLNPLDRFVLTFNTMKQEATRGITFLKQGDIKNAEKILKDFVNDFGSAYDQAAEIWEKAPNLALILGIPNKRQFLNEYIIFMNNVKLIYERGLVAANQEMQKQTFGLFDRLDQQILGSDGELAKAFEETKNSLTPGSEIFNDFSNFFADMEDEANSLSERLEKLKDIDITLFDAEQLETYRNKVKELETDTENFNSRVTSQLDKIQEREKGVLEARKDGASLLSDIVDKFKAINKDDSLSSPEKAIKTGAIIAQFKQDLGDAFANTGQDMSKAVSDALSNSINVAQEQLSQLSKSTGLNLFSSDDIKRAKQLDNLNSDQLKAIDQAESLLTSENSLYQIGLDLQDGRISAEEALNKLAENRVESLQREQELLAQQKTLLEDQKKASSALEQARVDKQNLDDARSKAGGIGAAVLEAIKNASVLKSGVFSGTIKAVGGSDDMQAKADVLASSISTISDSLNDSLTVLSNADSSPEEIKQASDQIVILTKRIQELSTPSFSLINDGLDSLSSQIENTANKTPKLNLINQAIESFDKTLNSTTDVKTTLTAASNLKKFLEDQASQVPPEFKNSIEQAINGLNEFQASGEVTSNVLGPMLDKVNDLQTLVSGDQGIGSLASSATSANKALEDLTNNIETQYGQSISDFAAAIRDPNFLLNDMATILSQTVLPVLREFSSLRPQGVLPKASGGYIKGRPMLRGMGTDTIPAALTPGEYVIRAAAVRKYGVDFMDLLNRGMYRYALGGLVINDKMPLKPISNKMAPNLDMFASMMNVSMFNFYKLLESYYNNLLTSVNSIGFGNLTKNNFEIPILLNNVLDDIEKTFGNIIDVGNSLYGISPKLLYGNASNTSQAAITAANVLLDSGADISVPSMSNFLSNLYGTIVQQYMSINDIYSRHIDELVGTGNEYQAPFTHSFQRFYETLNDLISQITKSYFSLDFTRRASGGYIKGKPVLRGMGTDTIPAALTPGEYVVRAAAVRKYGTSFLDMINHGMYRFASGGQVPSTRRPTLKVSSGLGMNNTVNNSNNINLMSSGNESIDARRIVRAINREQTRGAVQIKGPTKQSAMRLVY